MSDETLGAGQGALPPREDSASRPAVRYAQVSGGQYIFTQSPHNLPAIQVSDILFNVIVKLFRFR